MKNIDKKELNKVSGGMAWCVASDLGSDGENYYLDNEAATFLSGKGYSLVSDGPARNMAMSCWSVTDANGKGIGDNNMRKLLGNPVPRPF